MRLSGFPLPSMRSKKASLAFTAAVFFSPAPAGLFLRAEDWPQWRYDAYRSASSPESLPENLTLLWSKVYGPRTPCWEDPLNRDLMPYDRAFEPIVCGKALIVGFNDSDKVVALDTETGRMVWRFFTDGPVRLPPAAWKGRVFVACDDGFLYCLSAETGACLWRFQAAPRLRRILGNRRLISTWPCRAGPVVRDGTVYVGSGIWPFMGVFLYALSAQDGKVLWLNDAAGSRFTIQPHNSPAFAGIAPQGPLVATEKFLLVPGGRSVPACFDRRAGKLKYFHLAAYNKMGGAWVFANEREFFCHERRGRFSRFDLATGKRSGAGKRSSFSGTLPVVEHRAYYFGGSSVSMYRAGKLPKLLWRVKADARGDLIKAGNRLYAGGDKAVAIIALSSSGHQTSTAGELQVPGRVARLLAGDGKLFVVTQQGGIYALGEGGRRRAPVREVTASEEKTSAGASPEPQPTEYESKLGEILPLLPSRKGYAVLYGLGDGGMLEALLRQSSFHVIAFDREKERVENARLRFDALGLYGKRVHVVRSDILRSDMAPYLATLSMVHDREGGSFLPDSEHLKVLARSVRPYGGVLCVPAGEGLRSLLGQLAGRGDLAGYRVRRQKDFLLLIRRGPLPGSGVWTHLGGDAANTLCSLDVRVRLPLGILYFGGNSHLDVLPRHGHGPPELVLGGRLFIQGLNCLSARCVYTGRVLWKVEIPDLQTKGIYYDGSFKHDPYTTEYNQKHIPGANARGSNMVAAPDAIYVAAERKCYGFDPATGKRKAVFSLPAQAGAPPPRWAYLGCAGDVLLGGKDFADFSRFFSVGAARKVAGSGGRFLDFEKSASRALVALDRHTGKVLWETDAHFSFLHHGIACSADAVICLDSLPAGIVKYLSRRGKKPPEGRRLVAFDLASGRVRWEREEGVFGTSLAVSESLGIVLQSGRPSRDSLTGEEGSRMAAFRAKDGTLLWGRTLSYSEPPILSGDTIIAGGKFYDLRTGSPRMVRHPISCAEIPRRYVRGYGCNYAIACPSLVTFRSSSAGFFDLQYGGIGHFGGFKSGCTSNLVAADGVLNAPDYTRTCSCSFQNQTSLALVHDPEVEVWTYSTLPDLRGPVRRLGVNFGAPGDRYDGTGLLWCEYPLRGGPSPKLPVTVEGHCETFSHHSLFLKDADPSMRWIGASGLAGACTIRLSLEGALKSGISFSPQASVDDAEEDDRGKVTLSSTDLELTEEKTRQVVAVRFPGVPLERGTPLSEAYLQFTVDERSTRPTELTIRGVALGTVEPFVARRKSLSSLPLTRASVRWRVEPWKRKGTSGKDQRSPNVAAVLREIIRLPSWRKGSACAFVITGKGKRVAVAFDGSKQKAPRLVIPSLNGRMAEARGEGARYAVTLVFAEPQLEVRPGERVFNVFVNGKRVLENFDIHQRAGGRRDVVVERLEAAPKGGVLSVRLEPVADLPPVLCGLSVEAEGGCGDAQAEREVEEGAR